MGGHGGLNILPQKKWNVYNFDNREKVRLDEEAAAKEEQLKREQSRKRDSELRLEKLRKARGLATVSSAVDPNKPSPSTSSPPIQTLAPPEQKSSVATEKSEADSRHINLFEGIRIFDPIKVGEEGRREEKKGKFWRESKKVKKEEVRAVGPEDEKYRVGYGIAGKGVKLPWYLEKRAGGAKSDDDSGDSDACCDYDDVKSSKKRKAGGKKSLEELREERLKRESAEKQRERALIIGRSRRDVSAARDLGFSGRRR